MTPSLEYTKQIHSSSSNFSCTFRSPPTFHFYLSIPLLPVHLMFPFTLLSVPYALSSLSTFVFPLLPQTFSLNSSLCIFTISSYPCPFNSPLFPWTFLSTLPCISTFLPFHLSSTHDFAFHLYLLIPLLPLHLLFHLLSLHLHISLQHSPFPFAIPSISTFLFSSSPATFSFSLLL